MLCLRDFSRQWRRNCKVWCECESGSKCFLFSAIYNNLCPLAYKITWVSTRTLELCETDEGSSTALLESRGNLFSRLALRHGHRSALRFGPDSFLAPVLNGAIDTIVVSLSEKYIVYMMTCISARYTGFLTGWENDKGRPFVIIWMVMDVLRNAENILMAVMAKVRLARDV